MIKTEKEFIFRDPDSKALLNRNKAALDEYKAQKLRMNEIKMMADRINRLEKLVEMLISQLPHIKE